MPSAQTIRCRAVDSAGREMVWWVGIVGSSLPFYWHDDDRQSSMDEAAGDAPRGLCMFTQRYNAEQRILRHMFPDVERVIAEPNPLDMVCARCDATAEAQERPLLRCARCAKVYYCSKECQQLDWKQHAPV